MEWAAPPSRSRNPNFNSLNSPCSYSFLCLNSAFISSFLQIKMYIGLANVARCCVWQTGNSKTTLDYWICSEKFPCLCLTFQLGLFWQVSGFSPRNPKSNIFNTTSRKLTSQSFSLERPSLKIFFKNQTKTTTEKNLPKTTTKIKHPKPAPPAKTPTTKPIKFVFSFWKK